MNLYLLDAGGAGLFAIFIGLGIFFMALAILAEALIMMWMKYNIFRKAILQSTVANLASLAAGIVVTSSFSDVFDIDNGKGLLALFGITWVIEFIVLYLFNKQYPVGKTALVCLVMNIVTYGFLYLISVSY